MENKEQRSLEGKVIKTNNPNKTVVVSVERLTKHPLYGKILRKYRKYQVHNENQECKVGDWAVIQEVKPISKQKSWKLLSASNTSNTLSS